MAARTPADVALGPDHFLRFGTFAFSLMEKELGKPISQIFAQAGPDEKNTFELRTMTTLLWAGLQRHHCTPFAEACELFDELGADVVMAAVMPALQAGMPRASTGGNVPEPKGKTKMR